MYAVIMSGGSGTRFWPLSRKKTPKQFLNITGKGSLVVETCDRLKGLCSDTETILVMGRGHLDQAEKLFKDRGVHMIGEPVGRNTGPAIGLGAIYARHLGHEGAVAFLPADHYIADPSAFVDALKRAGDMAESGGIVTLGIVPVRPETGYGYIRKKRASGSHGKDEAYRVDKFVEKPDPGTALRYLKSGEYYWNAGIFVATPETILKEISVCIPDLHKVLMRIWELLGSPGFEEEFLEIYERIEAVSFDYGVMEKTKEDVFVIPCECGWSDVGSWNSLYELKQGHHDADKNLADQDTLLIDCRENFISAKGGRFIACLGIKNCLVVDTEDVLLVADIDRSQDIRKVVEELKKRGRAELL